MKQKKKCAYNGCVNPSFGKFCKYHSPKNPIKSSKLKAKKKSPEKLKADRDLLEKDWLFYLSIWNKRPHYCQACGKWLGIEPLTVFFDHCLEKSIYPQFRYEELNIFLCCWQHHSDKGAGFPHPKHQEAIDKAKQVLLKSSQ